MADKKISQLTALSAANLAPSTDVLAIVDTSATETKKIVAQDLINGVLNVASAVGIGTASPGAKLDVVDTAASTLNVRATNSSASAGAYVQFRASSDAGSAYFGVSGSGNAVNGGAFDGDFSYLFADSSSSGLNIGTGAAVPIRFYTNGSSSSAMRMLLDPSGNLGIGTSSPGKNLEVAAATDTTIRIRNTTTSFSNAVYGTLDWATSDSSTPGGIVAKIDCFDESTYGDRGALRFFTNNSVSLGERGRFTAGGDFGIGNSNPLYRLTVDKDTTSAISFFTNSHNSAPNGLYVDFSSASPNNATQYFLYCEDSTAQRATIRSNGGLANYQTNDVNLSDERVKTDIAPLGSMWAKIKALEIVTFKYKDQTHDDDNIGLIAQQVEAVAPEFVDADGWGETPEDGVPLKSIYTADMYHGAIKALQEAMARIESLEAKVSALEAK